MLFWHDLYSIIIWIGWYRCMISWMTLFMNTATYNSCYFGMNCILHFFLLMLIIGTWCRCSESRILPSYSSCRLNMNCIVTVSLNDIDAWYHELHYCEYYHIQLMLLWHELYFGWCNELMKLPSYNSCLFNTNCMVWYQSVLYCFVICLCCHK